jgi:hypothetical protein
MGSVIHLLWVSEVYVLLLVALLFAADVLVFGEWYCNIELQVAIELDPGIELVQSAFVVSRGLGPIGALVQPYYYSLHFTLGTPLSFMLLMLLAWVLTHQTNFLSLVFSSLFCVVV